MEKLIELLNEYDWTPTEWKQIWDKIYFDWLGWNSELHELIIISKYYGFIWWLVENDKIDTIKVDEDRLETIQYSEKERITIYNWLLMLLSISDEPIRFLCEFIK